MSTSLRRRRIAINAAAMGLSGAATMIGLACLFWILWVTIANGAAAIDRNLFVRITAHGGLSNAIVGSLVMDLMALAISTPVGIGAGIFLAEYASHSRLGSAMRFLNDILLSAPSIVLGLFIYAVMVLPTAHLTGGVVSFSGVAGAVALALIGLPVVVRTTDEMLRLVPDTLREAAFALGIPRWKVTLHIVGRAAASGIITGVLLALARLAGETAPLLFTAFGNHFMTVNPFNEMASVPIAIYQYSNAPELALHEIAWAGALLISLFVLVLAIAARWHLRTRQTRP